MARDNVERSTGPRLSRRDALVGSAGLTFVIGTSGLVGMTGTSGAAAASGAGLAPNAWVRLDADGLVTIMLPATEMGQGSSTALPLILAEELDADWSKVRVEQVSTDDRTYGNAAFGGILYTAGSSAVSAYFDTLRKAGAQARRVLLEAAARFWAVPMAELSTNPGYVVHAASGRQLSYGAIAALPDLPTTVPDLGDEDFKPREAYRLIGADVPRRDVRSKTDGSARYTIDVQVPGMAYAAVLRSPVEGEMPLSVDTGDVGAIPGVLRTIKLPDGVAVVAERIEAALAAKDRLTVAWSASAPARAFDSDADLQSYAAAAADLDRHGAPWAERGDARAALARAARVIEADYLTDYAYHAQMEPLAAVAAVDADGNGAEIWVGTQSQTFSLRTAAEALGTTPERIRMHAMTMGGGFGRRAAYDQEFLRDALLLSRELGRPIKVVWTREDDVRNGWFRPMTAQKLRAGLDSDGRVIAWNHRLAGPSVLASFNPGRWDRVKPKDVISMLGSESRFYAIPDLLAEHVILDRRARVAPYRGIGAGYTSFAAEAFVDEVAAATDVDPLAFRLRLVGADPRARRVLETVAAMSDWSRPRTGTALGVAFAGYGSSMAAGVAEVAVDRAKGAIAVHRFWAAVDAGLIISPKNTEAQVEGAVVFGLSGALKERITIRAGEVEQSSFYDYPILRANEVPEIAVRILPSDGPPTGVGELGTPMTGGAVANAVATLTGRRLRHLPFTPERVASALRV